MHHNCNFLPKYNYLLNTQKLFNQQYINIVAYKHLLTIVTLFLPNQATEIPEIEFIFNYYQSEPY